MENPLILVPTEDCIIKELGRHRRKANLQHHDTKVIRDTLYLFQQYLPEMFEKKPNSDRFHLRWPTIDIALRKKWTNEKDYRLGYNFLCQKLEKGNRDALWYIDVPEPYISIKRNRPTRTLRWQHDSSALSAIENTWVHTPALKKTTAQPSFTRLLISSIFYGGLNRPALWPSLAACLNQTQPFQGTQDCLYLVLHPTITSRRPSNVKYKDQNNEKYIYDNESLYFPDPITLSLIYAFLEIKDTSWQPPTSITACLLLINTALNTKLTQSTFSHGGLCVAEKKAGIDLPQVITEIALGKQASSSLPQAYWQRLQNPVIYSGTLKHNTSFVHQGFVRKKSLTNKNKPMTPFFLEGLQDIFSWPSTASMKRSSVLNELKSLSQLTLSLPEKILILWFIEHIDARKNALSTAKRYFHCIAIKWLISTEDIDFSTLNGDDFLGIYQGILDKIKRLKEREYCAGRLEDIHQFAVLLEDIPPLPEALCQGSQNHPHVSAGIIDEPLFKALLEELNRFSHLDVFEKKVYRCFLVMAFRTGLRPSELAKLRLKDIEPSEISWLFIKDNVYGSNKTGSALRKIPLMILLTKDEKSIFTEYIQERRIHSKKDTQLFFHQEEDPCKRIDISTLSRTVKMILMDLSGGLYFRLYHLRHSALSRLQLLLHHDKINYPSFIDALLPYDEKQREEIMTVICGKDRLRDRYHALACFAGHSCPEITLTNYLHFSDLILGLILQKNAEPLDEEQAQTLLKLRPFRIAKYRKNHLEVRPYDFCSFVTKRLSKYTKMHRPIKKDRLENQNPALTFKSASYKQMPYFVATAILNKIHAGMDHSDIAWFYKVPSTQIKTWIASAKALKNLKTIKNKSRLFPYSRRSQWLPPVPSDHHEREDIKDAMTQCRILFNPAQSEAPLLWAIQYALTHCNSSRSGIFFDDTEDYLRFIDVACALFPSTRWRLLLRYSDENAIKNWEYKAVEIQAFQKQQEGRFLQGSGWLVLKHKNEIKRSNSAKQSRYSSHSLRILFHRLAIVMFKAKDIKKWENATSKEPQEQLPLF